MPAPGLPAAARGTGQPFRWLWAAASLLALSSPGHGQVSLRPLPPLCMTTRTLVIQGDEAPFDTVKGVHLVRGNARAVRGTLVLTAREIQLRERESIIVSSGNVQVSDPSFILACGKMTYDMRRDKGWAEESPKVTRTIVPRNPGASMLYTELVGDRIDFASNRTHLSKDEGDMEATGDVVLVRYTVAPTGLQEDFRIHCDKLQSFNARRRTVFIGNFRLRSPKVGVDGERAIYYEDTNKFYVNLAQAWDIGPQGQAMNRISGRMIVHDARTGESKVIGQITGSFDEDQ